MKDILQAGIFLYFFNFVINTGVKKKGEIVGYLQSQAQTPPAFVRTTQILYNYSYRDHVVESTTVQQRTSKSLRWLGRAVCVATMVGCLNRCCKYGWASIFPLSTFQDCNIINCGVVGELVGDRF